LRIQSEDVLLACTAAKNVPKDQEEVPVMLERSQTGQSLVTLTKTGRFACYPDAAQRAEPYELQASQDEYQQTY
jgi:hypothetical protein